MSKICTRCKEPKELSEFYKYKASKDGLSFECRECVVIRNRDRNRTKVGLLKLIYNRQRHHSTHRGHPLPTYTSDELVNTIMDMPLYHTLHNTWVASGYKKDLIPSIDRIEDDKPYTEDNIQLMTWEENRDKHYKDTYEGNSTLCKPITQLTLDGTIVKKFKSISIASRKLELNPGNIVKVLKGNHKTCGGYKFKYTKVVA